MREGPDWKILPCVPSDPVEGYTEEQKRDFIYAFVTDDPKYTRKAVKDGWSRVIGQIKRTWTDTGLPCAMFFKRKPK